MTLRHGVSDARPVFGAAPSGVACHAREAAYVVITNTDGWIAASVPRASRAERPFIGCPAVEPTRVRRRKRP